MIASNRMRPLLACAAAAFACALGMISASPAIGADWASGLRNITAVQGRTLLALSRDFFQHPELSDSSYTVCIDPFDAAAADPQAKADLADAMQVVDGASRRMGYTSYPEISDEYERLRLSKMLAEGRWLRQFKKAVEQCLYSQPEVKAKLKRD